MKKNDKYYVKNKDLIPEIIKFKQTGVASEELGRMILLIAEGTANKPSYIGYTWKDDMIASACLTCIKYLKSFNPEKFNNPFSYITTICINSFKQFLNSQKKHREIKDEIYNKSHFIEENPFTAIDYTQMKKN